jgi:hypothetical protein
MRSPAIRLSRVGVNLAFPLVLLLSTPAPGECADVSTGSASSDTTSGEKPDSIPSLDWEVRPVIDPYQTENTPTIRSENPYRRDRDSEEGKHPNTAGFRVQLFFGEPTHFAIERRVADFQEDNDFGPYIYAMLAAALGVGDYNIGEAEAAFGMADQSFLDDDHSLSVDEFYVMFWYRRLIPMIGNVRLLPGVAIGYTWPYAKLQYYDPSTAEDDEPIREDSIILSGSGVTYAAGIELEIGIYKAKYGAVYLSLDYRHRFGPKIVASTRNGGDVFFPDRVGFDFEGDYFGFGLSWRWPM